MTWVDCHAHIDNLGPSERAGVIANARAVGVAWIINASDDFESCGRVVELAAQTPSVFGTVGIHPHHAKDVTEETYRLVEDLLGREKIVGIGEVGLDYHYDLSPREKQVEVFERFLDMAVRRNLPVVVHHRESAGQTVASLKKYCAKGLRGMIHCFSGNWDFAKECLDLGFYLSFSGILTFKKAQEVQDVAVKAPADKILLETDAPWLSPEPMRGKPNEPGYVVHTAARMAQLRGTSLEILASQTLTNCNTLFGLALA